MIFFRLCVFAILFICEWSKSAVACQEGVGGQDVNSPREVQAEGVIITWSEKNDELRGFSQKLGDWEVLKIDPQKLNPQQKITPVVDSNIAAVRFGDSIAAFSGEKGWWDVVELSKDSTAVPVVSPSLAVFEDNGHLYTFSASKGQWSSPTDPELQPATFEYPLHHERNEDGKEEFDAWLKQLPQHEGRRISLHVKWITSILITTTRQSTMKVARQKVEEFWCPKRQVAKEETPLPEPKRSSAEIDSQITKLRGDLAKLESTVQAGSGQSSNQNVDQDQHSRELRKLVEQSFDLRQQLQELEAQRLRLKLQQVENNLAVRAKSRDAMVKRRMEELLQSDSGNKVPPQEPDNRSTSRDIASDLTHVDPTRKEQQPSVILTQPLTTFGDDDSARIQKGSGAWNETLEIIKLLKEKKSGHEGWHASVQDYLQRQERLARPFVEWSEEERKKFDSTVEWMLRDGPAPREQLEFAAHIRDLVREFEEEYLREGIMKSKSQSTYPELTDAKKERIRADLVRFQEDVKEHYAERAANALREWNTVWNAYMARRKDLELSVSQAEETLDEIQRQKEKILVGDKSGEKSVASQIRRAELIVEQLRVRLQPFADLAKDHPELEPPAIQTPESVLGAEQDMPQGPPTKTQVDLPQQVISMAEQLRKLREAAEKFREERQPHENLITQYSRPLEQLKAEGVVDGTTTEEDLKTQIARSKPEFDRLTEKLDAATKSWKQAWGAYQSQSRLLELEVQNAQNSLASAEQTLAHIHAKSDQGLVGSQEVRDTEARRSAAVVQHEKSRELLHLWQEMEKNEPELNPDWKPESSGKNVPE